MLQESGTPGAENGPISVPRWLFALVNVPVAAPVTNGDTTGLPRLNGGSSSVQNLPEQAPRTVAIALALRTTAEPGPPVSPGQRLLAGEWQRNVREVGADHCAGCRP